MKKLSIAIIGYGKMGKEIEKFAINKGHTIACTIDSDTDWNEKRDLLKKADIAIEFSIPQVAVENIKKCFDLNLAIVTGTTGWHNHLAEISNICKEKNQTIFYASNYSIGVNILFEMNKKLASIMKNFDDYNPEIKEIHHIHKLDAPSGTAISLANGIIENNPKYKSWKLAEEISTNEEISINALREGNIFGIHEVTYFSEIDFLKISHSANSRIGFVKGALMAAEWVYDKKGIYTMQDLLNF
ncbi:MAG: 4-hydroxy-tetrahydrodipicolinate reductase [Bacteroidetes bacterium]|nr:4-hydroxy-tetrahydrodipicolinate reductase [Bacteroidota bacterium]